MYKFTYQKCIGLLAICLAFSSCKIPALTSAVENRSVPGYDNHDLQDSTNMAVLKWKSFFTDPNLVALIDSGLAHNQELMITLQEIEIARNETRIRQGQLLPSVGARIGVGADKPGRYTSQGAGDASTEITPGKEVPDPLTDYTASIYANWEVDIWKKLHNAKKAAVLRYLSTVEGKNFVLSNLIAEIADAYYELLALDNQLEIIRQNIDLQKNALEVIKIQKEAARVTELAVQKFRAEVLNSQGLEFETLQKIKETEKQISRLTGQYPHDIPRDKSNFLSLVPAMVRSGIPSQLLANRPDIKKAELELAAAKLDVKVARAEFYPSFSISGTFGIQAFKPSYLLKFPESMIYSLAGELAAPLINRNGIKAEFYNANARQLQAMYNYERTILNGYLEVSTQLSGISNLEKRYVLKAEEVQALSRSIDISGDLFKSARADYLEVLMTQRDALAARLELIETKKLQLGLVASIYRDLGGGWK